MSLTHSRRPWHTTPKPRATPYGIPACFSSAAQFVSYMQASRASQKFTRDGYCSDCTEEYQREMILARRCGYPGTTFDIDEDGFIAGMRSVEAKRDIVLDKQPMIKVSLHKTPRPHK